MSAPPARSALVTGATRGIGQGVATGLARRGYGLTITARNADALAGEAARLRAAGAPYVEHLAADMADLDGLPALVDRHRERFDDMSVLVLNAGVGTAGTVADAALHRVTKTFAVNVTAAFVLVQQSIALLRAAAARDPERGARVIALSSITGVHPEPGLAAYGASKAALLSFIETLDLEEQANGVHASAIAPGYVATDMSAWTTDTIPAESMIPVEDIVSLVEMLVSLSPSTSIPGIVVSRIGSGGRRA